MGNSITCYSAIFFEDGQRQFEEIVTACKEEYEICVTWPFEEQRDVNNYKLYALGMTREVWEDMKKAIEEAENAIHCR